MFKIIKKANFLRKIFFIFIMANIFWFIYLKSPRILKNNYRRQQNSKFTLNIRTSYNCDLIKIKKQQNILDLDGDIRSNNTKEQVYIKRNYISSKWWSNEHRGNYTVIRNFVLSDIIPDTENGITLTTQSTYHFLYHIEEQCKRWEGPISVAVYAPGPEFALTVHSIYYMRFCKHECITQNISWHLVYDTVSDPRTTDTYPFCDIEAMNFNCRQKLGDIYKQYSIYRELAKKSRYSYPINVMRNVARLSVCTKYVMAIDIELYPSVGLVPQFLQLVEREGVTKAPHVYVLPAFELKRGTTPPANKTQLKALLESGMGCFVSPISKIFIKFKGKAKFFHEKRCDECHRFPDRDEVSFFIYQLLCE